MSIAIVTWPINDVGGINSWCINFCKGLKSLGVNYQVYYATPQIRFGCDPNREMVKSRYALLPSKHLSYRDNRLKETIRELNQYDLIFMLHPSPHPTRDNAGPYSKNWMLLYRNTKPSKVVVFHDANWQKTNAWLSDVSDCVDAAIAAQCRFLKSVVEYPADCPKKWEFFPLDLEMAKSLGCSKKQDKVIVCTQWIKWKNHHKFLPQLLDVKPRVELYGNGQEYYTLRNNGVLLNAIRKDHTTGQICNRKSRHQFFGFVPYSQVIRSMSQSFASIDLSTKGYTNMTHWEPLTVGTVSMIEHRVAEHPDNQIPEGCFVPYDLDCVAEAINDLLTDKKTRKRVADDGWKFIQKSDCKLVAKRTIDWIAKNLGVKV